MKNFHYFRIKLTDEKNCINHIILVGIRADNSLKLIDLIYLHSDFGVDQAGDSVKLALHAFYENLAVYVKGKQPEDFYQESYSRDNRICFTFRNCESR